jgi:hypothetical protein
VDSAGREPAQCLGLGDLRLLSQFHLGLHIVILPRGHVSGPRSLQHQRTLTWLRAGGVASLLSACLRLFSAGGAAAARSALDVSVSSASCTAGRQFCVSQRGILWRRRRGRRQPRLLG